MGEGMKNSYSILLPLVAVLAFFDIYLGINYYYLKKKSQVSLQSILTNEFCLKHGIKFQHTPNLLFWIATSDDCSTCLSEIEYLIRLNKEFHPDVLTTILVFYSANDRYAKEFTQKYQGIQCILLYEKDEDLLSDILRLTGFPKTPLKILMNVETGYLHISGATSYEDEQLKNYLRIRRLLLEGQE